MSNSLMFSIYRGSALREFYKVKPADYMPSSIGPDLRRCKITMSPKENISPVLLNGDPPAHLTEEKAPGQSMFRQLAEDEFFDVPEDSPWDLEVPDLDEQHTDLEGTSDEDQVRQWFFSMCCFVGKYYISFFLKEFIS